MSPNGYDRFMWRRFNQFFHRFFPNQSVAKDLNARGVDLASQGSFQYALAVFEAALDANPNYPEVWANLGSCRAGIGDLLGACDAYSESLFQDAHQAPVLDNWANALARLGKLTAAVDKHQQAIEIDQSLIHAKANLGSTLWAMGRVDEGVTLMERAWASNPSDQQLASSTLSAAQYASQFTPAHKRWPATEMSPQLHYANSVDPLKVGYISPDFRAHSCACFLPPLFEAHDRKSFSITAYKTSSGSDEITRCFMNSTDHFVEAGSLLDEELADRIRRDRIDILIDCADHSKGGRRGVFAREPAPVQVLWLGYPLTTGLKTFDARLTDETATPNALMSQLFTEPLIALPGGFHCYRPLVETPTPSRPPSLDTNRIAFGVFRILSKFSDRALALWAAVLKEFHHPNWLSNQSDCEMQVLPRRLFFGFETMECNATVFGLSHSSKNTGLTFPTTIKLT